MRIVKTVAAFVMTSAILFSFAGCARFKVIDNENVFFDALEKTTEFERDKTANTGNSSEKPAFDKEYEIYAVDGSHIFTYIRFDNNDDAMKAFDKFYENIDRHIQEGDFTGSHAASFGKTSGSVTFNGTVKNAVTVYGDDTDDIRRDMDLYGGVYVNKNVYIEAYSIDGSKTDNETVDRFLKEIGFPKP